MIMMMMIIIIIISTCNTVFPRDKFFLRNIRINILYKGFDDDNDNDDDNNKHHE